VHDLIRRMDPTDTVLVADRGRLAQVRRARAEQAARYFADHASHWDRIRSLHVAEDVVEHAIRDVVGSKPLHAVLDLGTGTGRMLEIVAPLADRAVGIDQSPAMLNLARTRLEKAGLRQVQLRQGDLYALPVEREGYDLVILHQVLHYLDDPVRALREAARVLRPGGRLLVVDFAPHGHEFLRDQHAHRRLGFAEEEIAGYLEDAGLETLIHRDLPPTEHAADTLTVSLWLARDPRILSDQITAEREVA
jgi:demethylmenaquinone methyltransferase/2-methoxy-6-polyprenyl-1,4-benzoquinol methylase/ArsR family transcriptional regulator